MTPHCGTCARRPRANLTARNGQLWCPECLYDAAGFNNDHEHRGGDALSTPISASALSATGTTKSALRASDAALGMFPVVDIPRARRLRRVK